MTLRSSCATVLVLLLLALAGCGGDDEGGGEANSSGDDSADAGGTLSVAEYRKQGNAICAEALDEIKEIPEPVSPAEIPDYLERLFALSEKSSEPFESLEPPAELRADHLEAVRLNRDSTEQTDALVERVRAADRPELALLKEFEKLLKSAEFKRSVAVYRRLGLKECIELGAPAAETAPA